MAQAWYDKEPPASIIPTWVTKKLAGRPQAKTPGTPKVEGKMHKAMEQGRKAEAAVGDAIFNLMKAKKDMEEKIAHFISLNFLGTDCYLPTVPRAIKLAITIIKFIKKIQDYINEVMDIINALLDCIGLLMTLLAQLQAFFQNLLNQIATLLNMICNLRLPDLPSFPNLFGKFKFSGFTFSKLGAGFSFSLKFDKNFAFGACKIVKPGSTNTLGLPQQIEVGNGLIIARVTDASGPLGVPDAATPPSDRPHGVSPTGVITDPNLLDPANPDLRDPSKYPSDSPVFAPDYNPLQDLRGSLPNPEYILNDYALPANAYENNVLSLVGNEVGSAPLFINLNATNDASMFLPVGGLDPFDSLPKAEQEAILADLGDLTAIGGWTQPTSGNGTGTGKDSGWGDGTTNPLGLGGLGFTKEALISLYRVAKDYTRANINLRVMADNNFPPHTTSAWLRYMNRARTTRKGVWVEAHQSVWDSLIAPSLPDLLLPVKWNKDIHTGVVQEGADSKFALKLQALREVNPGVYCQTMWLLSILEASLLGCPRSTYWDACAGKKGLDAHTDTQVDMMLTGFSRQDLDYTPLHIALTPTLRIVLDQNGLAEYPSSVNVPGALEAKVREAIMTGQRGIAANKAWRTNLTQFSHGYTAYGETRSIDRYSQFWREWAANFEDMLKLVEPLQSMVFGYTPVINSFCNPLAADKSDPNDKGEFFLRIKRDVMLRNWDPAKGGFTWKPGQPSLPAPVLQLVEMEPNIVEVATKPDGSPLTDIDGKAVDYFLRRVDANGDPMDEVYGNGWSTGNFVPQEFLSRPDVRVLSPNVQMRMLECHEAAQSIMASQTEQESDMAAAIAGIEGEVAAGLATLDAFKGIIAGQLSAAQALISSYPVPEKAIVIPGGTYTTDKGDSVTIPDRLSPTSLMRDLAPPAAAIVDSASQDAGNTPVRLMTFKISDGTVCSEYEDSVVCQGGSAPYTWVVDGLPPGVTLDASGSKAKLLGVPRTHGSFNVKVKVTESNGTLATRELPLEIRDTLPLALTTQTLPGGQVGVRYSGTLSATGGKTPYTWDYLPAPLLHKGLALDALTGVISGFPVESGLRVINFRVRDTCGKVSTKAIPLQILPARPPK